MKAYKGFNENMTCHGFQYEEGKTYHEKYAIPCEKGFHACENPLDTFNYYAPANSVYHEVDLDEVAERHSAVDTKLCAKTIRIGARLDVAGICKAHFNYVKAKCIPANGRVAGDKESAAAGNWGSAAAGEHGSAAAGEHGSAAAGNWGSAAAGEQGSAAAGYRGSAAAGNWGSAAVGEHGSAAAGYWGSAAAGEHGSAAAGYRGSAAAGEHGIACCLGGKVKGGMGAVIAIAELDKYGFAIRVSAAIVDGKKIKADTWYTAKDGDLVEVKDNDR